MHSSRDNRRWSSSKTKWCAGTLTNNNSDLARFRQLKMLQKLHVTKFSNALKLKRTSAGLKKSSRKTCAMSFTSKKVNKQLLLASEPKWRRGSALNRSCKKDFQLRLKAERRAEELRMEDEFKQKLFQRFAEDEKLEQMNA